jgi:catechol 2,3-dioxygenase-like lactoylglutathione lyase family enzyme
LTSTTTPFTVRSAIPILRIFSEEKAREFYIDWLGFSVDWEHRFEPDMPLYMQISRGDLVLHLSEHHGDASPGARVFVHVTGLAQLHQEIMAKDYRYMRPSIGRTPWDANEMTLIDPFTNRLSLNEYDKAPS